MSEQGETWREGGPTPERETEILVWRKITWGSYGQHDNIYTFVVDVETLEQKAIFEVMRVRYENSDSRKNLYRYMYVDKAELRRLEGKIIKRIQDYASSSRRVITTEYFRVVNGELVELPVRKSLRDDKGFYDEVELGGKRLIFRKGMIEVRE
jgi:hypothetical protein